ncbi:MAG: hypothetical protein H6835_10200 [Planctomycetes bacterium]|nr:hypothetical protein [Planctomycetota bacterium]
MDTDLIEGAACAVSDLSARFYADLAAAQAQLAVIDARAHFALSQGLPIPADVRTDRILCRRQIAVLRQMLDGIPSIEGECHAASA